MTKRLINIKELAEYTGLSPHTIYSWVSQKRIPYVKVGRLTKFDLADIERFISRHKVEASDKHQ